MIAVVTNDYGKPARSVRRFFVFTLLTLLIVALAGCDSAPPQEIGDASEIIELKDGDIELEAQIDDLNDEIERLELQLKKVGDIPEESAIEESSLDEGEWQQGLAAAQTVIKRATRQRGKGLKITNMTKFVDAVSLEQGIYWSPLERQQFERRFQEWYRLNG